jgi:hypothetical protein
MFIITINNDTHNSNNVKAFYLFFAYRAEKSGDNYQLGAIIYSN